VTYEEAFNILRLIAGFGVNLTQEWRGVLVCSRREVKRENVPVKTAAVHCDIIALTAEFTEHSFELMLYFNVPAGLHIDAGHSHAIPNWPVHGASGEDTPSDYRWINRRQFVACGARGAQRGDFVHNQMKRASTQIQPIVKLYTMTMINAGQPNVSSRSPYALDKSCSCTFFNSANLKGLGAILENAARNDDKPL
jgi:hypothetical protein